MAPELMVQEMGMNLEDGEDFDEEP